MLGYGGAGPYPQCFDNLDHDNKVIKAEKKRDSFLQNATNFINDINPGHFIPFAGTYFLTGNLSSLQDLRGVPSIDYASDHLENSIKTNSKCIRLNVDNSINLKNFQTSKKYVPISERDIKNYIKNTLSKKQLSYELDEDVKEEELFNLAKKAHIRYLNKIEDIKIELNSNILIKVLEKYIFIDNKSSKISLIDKNTIHSMNNYILYTLNPKLLKKILMGPRYAHWNNAEIGSHIKFFRKPDIFDRRIYNAICYFHI